MKSSNGASAGTSKPLPHERGSAGIAIDNRYRGLANWLRKSCISMMQLFVSFGLTGISQSMSTPSYPFATTKSETFFTNVARIAGSAEIFRKAWACAGSPPPIEISTFTPAACAFEINAGSIKPSETTMLPRFFLSSSRKACEMWVRCWNGILAAL